MNIDHHQRARTLIAGIRVEGISDVDRKWLEEHLQACSRCTDEARATEAAIAAFRRTSSMISPEVVHRTTLAVRQRAQDLQARRERTVPLGIATVVSAFWVIVTLPYTWAAFSWLGQYFDLPNGVWQLAFLTWWFLPATVLAGVAAWRYTRRRDARRSVWQS
jgi:anti-sigma factor RsiW